MSFSWVDPHFVALYARREEERLVERLVTRLRERAACEPPASSTYRREMTWMEQDATLRGRISLL